MNIQQLKYAEAIVKYGTISNAAKHHFLSTSSISTSLKDLESELGIKIFTRSKRGMKLTEDGAQFIEYAQQVLAQLTVIEETYIKKKGKEKRLSIASQHYDFASEAFAQLVNQAGTDEYAFRFLETDTKKVIEKVDNHTSEIGIVYISEFNSKVLYRIFEKQLLHFSKLFEFQPHVFLGSHHPLSQRKSVTYKELSHYPAITFEQSSDTPNYYSEEPLELQDLHQKIFVSDRSSAINILIGSNSYLTGSGIMSSKLTKNDLVSIPIESIEQHQIGLLQKQDREISPLANQYIRLLVKTIEKKTGQ